jgi:hypothetical protein
MTRLTAICLLLTTGCGSTISNQVFYEDADFLSALPGPDHFNMDYPTETTTEACDANDTETAAFFCITVDALETGNGLIETLTALTDVVRLASPSERGDDYRVWGPGDWIEKFPGNFLRVEMSRSPTRSAYSWSFQLARTSQGPWDSEVIFGTHYAGEIDVSAGVGDLVLDLDALAEIVGETGQVGRLTAAYDARDSTEFSVLFEGQDETDGSLVNSQWTYQEMADGGGDLIFDSDLNLDNDTALEKLALRTRWRVNGDGRGDSLVHSDDLTGSPRSASQCWKGNGDMTWHTDEFDWMEDTGSESECAFADAAFPALETGTQD